MSEDNPKTKFIKAIHARRSHYNALAQIAAMEFVRSPDDEALRRKAERTFAIADTLGRVYDDIVGDIDRYWPK